MDLRIDNNTSLTPDANGAATWTFTTVFIDDPIVTAIVVGELADANVYISAISKTAVTFQTNLPAEFVAGATIYAHAISATARRRSPPMLLSGS